MGENPSHVGFERNNNKTIRKVHKENFHIMQLEIQKRFSSMEKEITSDNNWLFTKCNVYMTTE